jgi:hypothetical protein
VLGAQQLVQIAPRVAGEALKVSDLVKNRRGDNENVFHDALLLVRE